MILKNGILLNVDSAKINLFGSNIMADKKEEGEKKVINEGPSKSVVAVKGDTYIDELTHLNNEKEYYENHLINVWKKTCGAYNRHCHKEDSTSNNCKKVVT